MRLKRLTLGALLALALPIRCDTTSPVSVGTIPPRPDKGVTSSDTTSTFAIAAIYLGDMDFSRTPSTNAWRGFGFNLDGLTTTATSTDVCVLQGAADPTHQDDGDNGIDNAFGAELVPILEAATSVTSLSDDQSNRIGKGEWTVELSVKGLSSDSQQTATGLDTQAFVGARLDTTPAFDVTTDWPVSPSSLNDGVSISSGALTHFSDVYVTHGTVVAEGAAQPLVIPLQIQFYCFSCLTDGGVPQPAAPFPLRIHRAVVVFDQSTSRGVIGGLLDPAELADTLTAFGHRMTPPICGSAMDGVTRPLFQMQDILADGTNAPNVPCNAISIGLGFVALRIANPTRVGVDPTPTPDLCDAGAEASDATTD